MTRAVRSIRDVFSQGASRYATARPRYPAELFDFLAAVAPERSVAWDCATGNGQAAVGLAAHFRHVIATDASEAQVRLAPLQPNVSYHVALAEASGVREGTMALTTVAQALHWLEPASFHAEVRRVTVPGGVIAAWSYGHCSAGADIEQLLRDFEDGLLGPYWHAERRWVLEGYRTIPFPYREIPAPPFELRVEWSLSQLGEYLRSWSAVARYQEVHGDDPVGPVLERITNHWGPAGRVRTVVWPLAVRIGRVG